MFSIRNQRSECPESVFSFRRNRRSASIGNRVQHGPERAVTLLRKYGTPEHVIKQWIGHSALDKRTTDTYCHTDQDLAYRQEAAGAVGLNRLFGPKGLVLDPSTLTQGEPVKSEL